MAFKKNILELADRSIPFTVRISQRAKKLRIIVSRKNGLEVVLPGTKSQRRILSLLKAHSKWIEEKLDHLEKTSQRREAHPIGEKTILWFLGREYRLRNNDMLNDKEIEFCDDSICMNLTKLKNDLQSQDRVREKLKEWYSMRAREIILERVDHYSQKLGVTFNRIAIKNQKTRWGSCSSLKNLNFNWRLIMAPPEVLEYIVVHELVHLKELNHSARFWNMVRDLCPDYSARDRWLRENGHLLTF